MDFQDLKKLTRQGESLRVEFKLKATHPEKIVREAVAFANTEGGYLLLGVSDEGIIRGVKFPLEEEYVMVKALAEHATPALRYHLTHIPTEGEREVLAFYIPKSEKIHYYLEQPRQRWGKAVVRVEDKSVQASHEMLEILRGQKRQRTVTLRYGDKERLLLQYLTAHTSITVSQFCQAAQISRHIASKTLILMVLSNILRIVPHEQEDFFVFPEHP